MSTRTGLPLFILAAFFCLYLFTASPLTPLIGDGAHIMESAITIWESGFSEPEKLSKYGIGQVLVDLPAAPLAARLPQVPSPLRRMALLLIIAVIPAGIAAEFHDRR
jgi:hypothetical protein